MEPAQALSLLLERRLRELRSLLRQVHARAQVEPIHKLRVLTRRLRSMARLADPSSRDFRRRLRKVGRALSECRALDVAILDCAAYGLETLRPKLHALREKASERVRRVTRPDRSRKILSEGHALAARWRSAGTLDARIPWDRVAGLARSLRSSSRKSKLHRFRIEVKKCRYVLETLARLKLAPRGTRLRPLRRIQSALGRAHDLEVLRQYARRRMPLLQREERGWVTRALRLSRAAFRER